MLDETGPEPACALAIAPEAIAGAVWHRGRR
jgi:hypothetical protein